MRTTAGVNELPFVETERKIHKTYRNPKSMDSKLKLQITNYIHNIRISKNLRAL